MKSSNTNITKHFLKPDQLTSRVPDQWLPFTTTAELPPHDGLLGQDRAMRAVDVGLNIATRGFNIFAVGEAGSGKTSTLQRILEARAAKERVPSDVAYVYNFRTPDRPRALLLPPGRGRELAADMERVTQELQRMVPRVLSDGAFGHLRASIMADTRKKAEDLVGKARTAATLLDLRIDEDDENLRVIPLVDGEPISPESYEGLSERKRRKIEANMIAFQEHLDAFSYGRRQLERDHSDRLCKVEVRAIRPIVNELFGELQNRYRKLGENVIDYLTQVRDHVLANHLTFMPAEEAEHSGEEGGEAPQADDGPLSDSSLATHGVHIVYRVNVVVSHQEERGAPVVLERVPTVSNLAGYIEYREAHGGLVTDHTGIRAGALQQANGGYLLVQAQDILSQDGAWDCLKRALRHKEIRIDEGAVAAEGRPRIAGTLKPGTVPLRLKVIVVGSLETYYFLKIEDDEFGRLFKVKADFEPSMERTKENVMGLSRFLGQVCREEGHLPLHRTGMKRILEFACRRAGNKARMTTRWASLLDLIAEANFFAHHTRGRAIRAEHVSQALAEARLRHGSMADAYHREVEEGSILIRTGGDAVGQISGIALYDIAGFSFGMPMRITARTYAGRRGVVNIDREVHLSGAIHDKGALILVGYLGGRYAQNQTLGLSASITFEQSYDEIDGDSASSSELYALLSALSGCPIKQGIAVTGSVNQLGEVQPIGGVNEKIEGIFQMCRARGLTGEQGVMIPKSNVRNLMLDQSVIEAVRAGQFHIYAVSTVDEGIEVLTGVPAGHQRHDGSWTADSINFRVQRRLEELGQIAIRERAASTALDRYL
ncbi:MAG: AAA family ATPase [Myxococcota bacterium]|nr:AAA family ATPase [Myxococcota bacterium]